MINNENNYELIDTIRLFSLRYSINKFNTLDFNVTDMDDMLVKLQNKNYLKTTQNMLNNLNNYINHISNRKNLVINSKIFLSLFLIIDYPENILNNHKLSAEIYQISLSIKNLLNNLQNSRLNIYKFYNLLLKYNNIFEEWKNIDKIHIIQELIANYIELDNILIDIVDQNNDTNTNDIELIKDKVIQEQNKIKIRISKLDKNGLIRLEKTVKNYQETRKNINNIMKNVYWENFKNNLKEKKYESIIDILEQTISLITNLIPNRKDKHIEINEYINLDLLKQMIENDAINSNYIYKMVMYINNWTKDLDSLDNDIYYKSFTTEINNFFEKGFELHTFFPWFFKKILDNLNTITNNVNKFKQSKLYKKLLDDLKI